MSKIIERIAAEMGCAYIYDDWGRINLKADKYGNRKQTRLIIETLPTNGQIDTQFSPIIKTSRTCIVAFLKPCALDFEGAEVGYIIDEMLDLAKDFIKRLDSTRAYLTRDQTCVPCIAKLSLNPWTTREVPTLY